MSLGYVDANGRPLEPAMSEVVASASMIEALGAPDARQGNVSWWHRIAPCGLVFSVEHFAGQTVVWAATAGEVRHALLHLPFGAVVWASFERASGGWALSRIDDGGFEHDMDWLVTSEAAARCVCECFERRGHKQTYVVRQRGVPPRLVRIPGPMKMGRTAR